MAWMPPQRFICKLNCSLRSSAVAIYEHEAAQGNAWNPACNSDGIGGAANQPRGLRRRGKLDKFGDESKVRSEARTHAHKRTHRPTLTGCISDASSSLSTKSARPWTTGMSSLQLFFTSSQMDVQQLVRRSFWSQSGLRATAGCQ